MSVKGSPVTKTQVGLLSEFGPFDEARKIESFSLPIHDENWEETDSHVDGISRLRKKPDKSGATPQ